MKTSKLPPTGSKLLAPSGERGSARLPLLMAGCVLFGLAGGAYWHYRMTTPHTIAQASQPIDRTLAEGTQRVIQSLEATVAIRFYSVLDTNVPAALRQFAGRADQLLGLYQEASHGKLKVTRYKARSNAAEAAALADGFKPFNLDRGEACYLGISVANKDQVEAVELSPDWEPALEFDLSRALARVNRPKPAPGAPEPTAAPDRAAIEAVKRALPNFASLSLADGIRQLQDQTMSAFTNATQEMAVQTEQAEQRLAKAQRENSPAALEAARAELQKVRSEQMEKLKAIGLQAQAMAKALEQIKQP